MGRGEDKGLEGVGLLEAKLDVVFCADGGMGEGGGW